MKLVSASYQASISRDVCEDNYSNLYYAPKAAFPIAKYWVLSTEITNTGKELIYLTCSYPPSTSTPITRKTTCKRR